MNFTHLNVKSCFSLMNSIVKINEAVVKASKSGFSHLAITDNNVMHTFYDFQKACKDDKHVLNGNNPINHIFGMSLLVQSKYIEDEFFSVTLLAKNEKGYRSLIELSTLANTNKHQIPYVKYDDIYRFYEGLICLTGGENGEIFHLETHNQRKEALELLQEFKGVFNTDLYLEVTNHFIPEEIFFLENGFIDLAIAEGVKPVATNNVHYLNKKDSVYRAWAIEMNPELNNLKSKEVDWVNQYAARYVNYNDEFYMKTEKQMEDAFKKYLKLYPDILSESQRIANQCQVDVPVERKFPKFPIPDGYSVEQYFRELMLKGFEERFPNDDAFAQGFTKQDYLDRMEYEYGVIEKMGFLDYLLIVQDYINFAKDDKVYEHPEVYFPKNHFKDYSKLDNDIVNKDYFIRVGPGRGSGAGSLLCYLLKITDIEPLQYGLLFERFLNVERVSMPENIGQTV